MGLAVNIILPPRNVHLQQLNFPAWHQSSRSSGLAYRVKKGVLRGRARDYFCKYKCFLHLIPLQGLTLKGLVINLSSWVF